MGCPANRWRLPGGCVPNSGMGLGASGEGRGPQGGPRRPPGVILDSPGSPREMILDALGKLRKAILMGGRRARVYPPRGMSMSASSDQRATSHRQRAAHSEQRATRNEIRTTSSALGHRAQSIENRHHHLHVHRLHIMWSFRWAESTSTPDNAQRDMNNKICTRA